MRERLLSSVARPDARSCSPSERAMGVLRTFAPPIACTGGTDASTDGRRERIDTMAEGGMSGLDGKRKKKTV